MSAMGALRGWVKIVAQIANLRYILIKWVQKQQLFTRHSCEGRNDG